MFNVLNCAEFLGANSGDLNAVASIVRLVITLIQIGVPILLVVFGMLDLGKAVMAQKEDEIKKGQQTLIKRCIAAAIVFFVITIVRLLVSVLLRNNDEKGNITDCINCFISNEGSC